MSRPGPRLSPLIQFATQKERDESLRLLAASGATPRQMLWGVWWCRTVPAICKSLAAVVCAGLVSRLVSLLFFT